ncbi:MAG: guanylate kinase [bacterium]
MQEIKAKSGILVVVSSPSGGGKDSIINALLEIFKNSDRFVTTTSRPKRPGNRNGVDYHFISEKEFKKKISNDEFIEYNIYAGNYYGTQKKHLKDSLAKYQLVFTQVEVNGKHNLDKAGIKHISIFLLPENLEILKQRIVKRGGISTGEIERRIEIAKNEIIESNDYDYRIVNLEGKLKETINKIAKIIKQNIGAEQNG